MASPCSLTDIDPLDIPAMVLKAGEDSFRPDAAAGHGNEDEKMCKFLSGMRITEHGPFIVLLMTSSLR